MMQTHKYTDSQCGSSFKMKIYLYITFTIFCTSILGQDCKCPTFEKNKEAIDIAIESNDSLSFTNSLRDFSNIDGFCKILSLSEQIRFNTQNQRLDKAILLIKMLEEYKESKKCSDEIKYHLLILKADYYQKVDSIEIAMDFAIQFLAQAEKRNNDIDILKAISQIGTLYVRQGQDIEFKPYIYKANKIILTIKEPSQLSKYYNWLARYYETEFTITENKMILDTAEMYALNAYELSKKYNQNFQLFSAFQALDAIAYHKGEFKQSLRFQDSTYKYMQAAKVFNKIPIYFQSKAFTLLEMGNIANTVLHQDSAIYFARKYSQPSFLANFLKTGAEIYEAAGDKVKALNALKEYDVLRDKINNEKRTKIINELEQKYLKEKSEKTILTLSNERKLLWLGMIMLGCLGMGFFFWSRNKQLKQKQIILETEQRLNRARMNPHFFFNALASLQSFAINETDAILLAENLSKFSHIMRETLENTYREYVTIRQEESFLREYLELQQLRFPEKFDFKIFIDNNLDENNLLIPSMIVQPFIENSVEHGFANIQKMGYLSIDFKKENENVIITVIDDGHGLNYNAPQGKPHVSRASQIIRDRIYLLNLKLKSRASFSIENNKIDGVTVTINLPLIYED
ncbi:MAG TPA: histidine kinase [Saprospiraceae bacterium]|nr:histidine kinase [Saprospiraceae bacterium]